MGNFALKSTYLIAVVGFTIVFAAFNRQYQVTGVFGGVRISSELIVAAVAYFALAPVAFLVPLSAAHRAMKEAKDELLLNLSRSFEETYRGIHSALTEAGEAELGLIRLRELQELHQLMERFPVWPFNAETLRRFFASILSPVLLAVLPSLVIELLGFG